MLKPGPIVPALSAPAIIATKAFTPTTAQFAIRAGMCGIRGSHLNTQTVRLAIAAIVTRPIVARPITTVPTAAAQVTAQDTAVVATAVVIPVVIPVVANRYTANYGAQFLTACFVNEALATTVVKGVKNLPDNTKSYKVEKRPGNGALFCFTHL